ncbi:hypothetical protein AAY24_02575 [Sedimenticola thiotaurini]|uniref:Uncharacterized protein n=1 Tax=Sedimenticola thiotaurini TaxID=1543721 RepID=A0A0F7JSE6_9GAMM|nr:hypothetical protein AAY24_02575 [Sedimenticola thiotaurini]
MVVVDTTANTPGEFYCLGRRINNPLLAGGLEKFLPPLISPGPNSSPRAADLNQAPEQVES